MSSISEISELTRLRKQAESLARAGDWGEYALNINKKMLEIDRNASDALTRLGRCYQEDGNFIVAYEMYGRALEADPFNTVARNKLKLVEVDARKEREKQQKEALRQQKEVLKQQKEARRQIQKNKIAAITNYDEVYQLGLAKKKRGHFDLAVAAFLRAIELFPESPYTWVSLGSAYRQNNNAAEAYRAFERALELGGDEDIVLVGMAAVKNMIGDTVTAIELYNKVLKRNHRNVYALYGLAAVYSSIRDLEKAGKLFGRIDHITNRCRYQRIVHVQSNSVEGANQSAGQEGHHFQNRATIRNEKGTSIDD